MSVQQAYDELEGAKDFHCFFSGWKARIPPELEARAKDLVKQLDQNSDYVISKGRWLEFLYAVAGRVE